MKDKIYSFRENKSESARIYTLQGSRLIVSGKKGFSGRFQQEFDLSSISEESNEIRIYHPALKRGINAILFVLVIAWIIRNLNIMPDWALAILSTLFALPGLIVLIKFLLPMDFICFSFKTGESAFDISKFRGNEIEFDEFAKLIENTVRTAQSSENNDEA